MLSSPCLSAARFYFCIQRLEVDLEDDAEKPPFLHDLSPNDDDDPFATFVSFIIFVLRQKVWKSTNVPSVHRNLRPPSQLNICASMTNLSALGKKLFRVRICEKGIFEGPMAKSMTLLCISSKEPSFNKTVFNLVEAEHHERPH